MTKSGLDDLLQRYDEDIVVELRHKMSDGKPFAVKLRQPRGILWLGLAGGIPVPTGDTDDHERVEERKRIEWMQRIRRVVARSIFAMRDPVQNGSGKWEDNWIEVNVLCDRQPKEDAEKREIHIESIDRADNVTRCFNALMLDLAEGGDLVGTEAEGFPDPGGKTSRIRVSGGDVRDAPARTDSGKTRRARKGHSSA